MNKKNFYKEIGKFEEARISRELSKSDDIEYVESIIDALLRSHNIGKRTHSKAMNILRCIIDTDNYYTYEIIDDFIYILDKLEEQR